MEMTKDFVLTDIEKDAVGEIANICMGSAATALSTILGKKVEITTPTVSQSAWKDLYKEPRGEYVCVQVSYIEGIEGNNVLLLDVKDAISIANMMMGTTDNTELSEIELSAVGEATNQMIGASTTTLSNILGNMVDIDPPIVKVIDDDNFEEEFKNDEYLSNKFIQIRFKLEIEDVVDSYMIQIYPFDFVELICKAMGVSIDSGENENKDDIIEDSAQSDSQPEEVVNDETEKPKEPENIQNTQAAKMYEESMKQAVPPNMMGMPNQQAVPNYMYMPNQMNMGGQFNGIPGQQPFDMGIHNNVNVQSAQFTSFIGNNNDATSEVENIELIRDVPLEVTVELGRTNKSISEILEFKPGTIVELNKVAGDPIDVLVNGKLVARGEVVVIDESFGIRIVEILK